VDTIRAILGTTRLRHPGAIGRALVLACGLAAAGAAAQGSDGAPAGREVTAVVSLIDTDRFDAADAAIDKALADETLDSRTREALLFQRERMRRILIDFHLDEEEVLARLRKAIPDLTEDEFQRWKAANLLEHRVIDGQPRYFARAVPNLFRLSPEAAARRADPRPFSEGPMESPNAHHAAVLAQAEATGRSSVLPRRVHVTQSITVDADAVPAGETVRAWIPYPRAIAGQQEDIRLLDSEPATPAIAPDATMQRTAYLEQVARAGEPTEFSIDYELTLYAQHHAIDPERVVPAPVTAELARHLGERPPHIVFTPALREFSRKVVGDETNPYRIAQKLFAAVDDIPWAGAREYSTITNISDYALHAGHADCGQQTLLLMTLLRLNGIPARWQSGMVYSDDDYWNLHDWGWMYLAPYGWVPMDVTTGRFEQEPALEWFYLGGFDGYRIAFTDDYGREFVPAKQHFRSETVDLQRGEAEWQGGNLYFDQWDYDFAWRELPGGSAKDAQ